MTHSSVVDITRSDRERTSDRALLTRLAEAEANLKAALETLKARRADYVALLARLRGGDGHD
jgi:hypothetical protein